MRVWAASTVEKKRRADVHLSYSAALIALSFSSLTVGQEAAGRVAGTTDPRVRPEKRRPRHLPRGATYYPLLATHHTHYLLLTT